MLFKFFSKKFFFIFLCSLFFIFLGIFTFFPIYTATSVIIPYSLNPYDICKTYPLIWNYLKLIFVLLYFVSSFICSNFLYSFLQHCSSKIVSSKSTTTSSASDSLSTFQSDLLLLIGKNEKDQLIFLPEQSLYQNLLITGTIGTGKTSSCMYPFTKQLIQYQSNQLSKKLGILILDVKGNYYSKVMEFANSSNRLSDLCILELGGTIKYNPLHKPHLKASVIANMLKTILTLFSPNNSESYWLSTRPNKF